QDQFQQVQYWELELLLKTLETACQRMKALQTAVRDATISIADGVQKNNGKLTAFHKQDCLSQADKQKEIFDEAAAAAKLPGVKKLAPDFFPPLKAVREKVRLVALRLEEAKVQGNDGETTLN